MRLILLILLSNKLIFTTIGSVINSPECGKRIYENRNGRFNKIIGGEEAIPGDWGWQIALYFSNNFICGGSLLNSEWIVTAAHCVQYHFFPMIYKVYLGVHNRLNPEKYSTSRSVSKIIKHPNYNSNNLHNDIALLKLSNPVEFNDHILPICLPEQGFDFTEKKSFATGWGSMVYGGRSANKLMQMESDILKNGLCEKRYESLGPSIFDSTINVCAGGNGKSTCNGDSGGPLVVKIENRWFLAGITSWGLTENGKGCHVGGVFARASSFSNWIKDKIGGNAQ